MMYHLCCLSKQFAVYSTPKEICTLFALLYNDYMPIELIHFIQEKAEWFK